MDLILWERGTPRLTHCKYHDGVASLTRIQNWTEWIHAFCLPPDVAQAPSFTDDGTEAQRMRDLDSVYT